MHPPHTQHPPILKPATATTARTQKQQRNARASNSSGVGHADSARAACAPAATLQAGHTRYNASQGLPRPRLPGHALASCVNYFPWC
jgi:hypothetical protein